MSSRSRVSIPADVGAGLLRASCDRERVIANGTEGRGTGPLSYGDPGRDEPLWQGMGYSLPQGEPGTSWTWVAAYRRFATGVRSPLTS